MPVLDSTQCSSMVCHWYYFRCDYCWSGWLWHSWAISSITWARFRVSPGSTSGLHFCVICNHFPAGVSVGWGVRKTETQEDRGMVQRNAFFYCNSGERCRSGVPRGSVQAVRVCFPRVRLARGCPVRHQVLCRRWYGVKSLDFIRLQGGSLHPPLLPLHTHIEIARMRFHFTLQHTHPSGISHSFILSPCFFGGWAICVSQLCLIRQPHPRVMCVSLVHNIGGAELLLLCCEWIFHFQKVVGEHRYVTRLFKTLYTGYYKGFFFLFALYCWKFYCLHLRCS